MICGIGLIEFAHWQSRASKSLRALKIGLRRSDRLSEAQPLGGGDMTAQHAAGRGPQSALLLRGLGWEGGVLGSARKRSESPRGRHSFSRRDELSPTGRDG